VAKKKFDEDEAPKRFMCENCFSAPQLPSSKFCNGCLMELKNSQFQLMVYQNNIRASRIKILGLRKRKLVAGPDAPLKRIHPYEVSFVVDSGMRVAESFHRVENAQTRFNELKLDNACGLRLSVRNGDRLQEINSHNGTYRPHIRRSDDMGF
jgi:hypothetical protein